MPRLTPIVVVLFAGVTAFAGDEHAARFHVAAESHDGCRGEGVSMEQRLAMDVVSFVDDTGREAVVAKDYNHDHFHLEANPDYSEVDDRPSS